MNLKRLLGPLLLGIGLALGIALVAHADTTPSAPKPLRSIDPTDTELEAVTSVRRRSAELAHELELVQLRANRIGEESRATHQLPADERMEWNPQSHRWDVYSIAPVRSDATAAPASSSVAPVRS